MGKKGKNNDSRTVKFEKITASRAKALLSTQNVFTNPSNPAA